MMKIWKRIAALLLSLAAALSLTACDEETDLSTDDGTTWAVYWYLCGSDLESGGGFASCDLFELLETDLPENVTVVIQTGGAEEWQNDFVESSVLQRYVYDSDGLYLVDEQPSASMGDSETLEAFLRFAKDNYPADKTAVVFWNHGGGSVAGASFDELYDYDSLTLAEMYAAFNAVWDISLEEPPLELVGFDTCLMATVDTAYTFCDISRYLVASEETEPANGWLYSHWVQALADDPSMDGATLGRIICDSYYEGCEEMGLESNATLSVTDLTRIGVLLDAYEKYGVEALSAAAEDPGFLSRFRREADRSENYGGNTREQGYTNMVDLGSLARRTVEELPAAQKVLDALDECVLYRVSGPYRSEATGLSCYYSYSNDISDLNGYFLQGTGEAFKYLYSYQLTGELDIVGLDYLERLGYSSLPQLPSLASAGWDNAPLTLSDDGFAVLTLGEKADTILAGVGFSLYYMDEEEDVLLLLGTDNDINADWENGVFTDNFRGVWGSIDDCLVYMELSYESEDYNLYAVPILLNGEPYNLEVAYDFDTEAWYILGARQGIDESGMADKELRQLVPGDEISTVWYLASLYDDDDFEPYEAETLTVTEDTAFGEVSLPAGRYMMLFEFWDAQGNSGTSQSVTFDVDGDDITATVCE